jgi:predicted small lipoprotein YifL
MTLSPSILAVAIAATLFVLAGCEKEGPAERAGENIDEAVEDMQQSAESTGDKIKESLEEAGDEVEEAPAARPGGTRLP